MELVYLWVEDYKNIEKEGFNFSPRFECEFKDKYELIDGKEKLKNNCELIIKDKEHLKDFFGGNINITAIVGENGSGKSSLLEALLGILSSSSLFSSSSLKKDYLLVYEYNKQIYFNSRLLTNLQKLTWIKKPIALNLLGWQYQYSEFCKKSNKPIYFNSNIEFNFDKNLLQSDREEATPFSMCKDVKALYLDNQTYTEELDFLKKLETIPSKYKSIQIDVISPNKNKNSIQLILLQNMYEYKNTLLAEEMKKFFIPNSMKIYYKNIDRVILASYEKDKRKEIENKEEKLKELLNNSQYEEFMKIQCEILDILQVNNGTIPNIQNLLFGNKYHCDTTLCEKTSRLKQKLKNGDESKNLFCIFDAQDLDKETRDFLSALPKEFFEFELFDDNKSFNSLSYGESQLIIQFNYILYYSKNRDYTKYTPPSPSGNGEDERYETKKVNNILLFLDELEIGFHPIWQKKAFKYMLDLLTLITDKKFNIIITSHSPFIISDLPKENIIFLEKDKTNGRCINLTKDITINPFGANIHTLLSHGFFMDGGLMGEFAKGKINEIIRNLSDENYQINNQEKKQLLLIINNIGEEFLKDKLTLMYNKKFPKSKNEQIKVLQRQIDELNK